MTITIPADVQHPPPVDGFANRPFTGVSIHSESTSAVETIDTVVLAVTADVEYSDGSSDADVVVVPSLRPFHSAALHVVGQSFVEAISGLTKDRIRRFR